MNKWISLVPVAALLGCAVEGEELAVDESELNGVINAVGCTDAQKARLGEAAKIALSQLSGSKSDEMLTCMKEASISDARNPEWLLAYLAANVQTTVVCDFTEDQYLGHDWFAINGEPYEKIVMDRSFIDEPCAIKSCAAGVTAEERVAAALIHGASDSNGGTHFDGDFAARPYEQSLQLEACSLSVSRGIVAPNGGTRSGATHRVELGHVGSQGGSPFGEIECGGSGFARGLHGRAGSRIDAIGLRCVTPDGQIGRTPTVQMGSPSGGTPFVDECPVGSLLVGVYGRSKTELDAVGAICATAESIENEQLVPSQMGKRGGGGGLPFERLCPAGKAVKAFAGRSAARVDQLSLICQDVEHDFTPSVTTRVIGAVNGTRDRERCVTGAMTGLFGIVWSGTVAALGAECHELRQVGGTLSKVGSPRVVDKIGSPITVGNFGMDRCGAGEALVGMGFRTGSRIDAAWGYCADIGDWTGPDPDPLTDDNKTSERGGPGGVESTRICPEGKFVTGWDVGVNDDYEVIGVKLFCSDFAW